MTNIVLIIYNPKIRLLMRTLKITFALLAIVVLTVSGVQSKETVTEEATYNTSTNVDLLVHNKTKLKAPPRG